MGCFHESEFEELNPRTMLPKANGSGKGKPLASCNTVGESVTRGALADKAASILMQVLYVARYARFDLLCAVAKLAQ